MPKKSRKKPVRSARRETQARPESPNRTRRLAGAKFRVLAVLCLGGGTFGLFLAGSDWYSARQLKTHGVETHGKIVGLQRHVNRDEAPTIKATIRYEITGKAGEDSQFREATLPVSQATYDRWKADNSVPVRYLPDDPTHCSVEDSPPDLVEKLAIGGGSFLVGLVLSYLAFYRWPRKARAEAADPPA